MVLYLTKDRKSQSSFFMLLQVTIYTANIKWRTNPCLLVKFSVIPICISNNLLKFRSYLPSMVIKTWSVSNSFNSNIVLINNIKLIIVRAPSGNGLETK